uniref:Uncharacterized protein n=1 Tax=Glossina austeni TaxID=7395 RepID=A0A1A9VVT3_GLOAU
MHEILFENFPLFYGFIQIAPAPFVLLPVSHVPPRFLVVLARSSSDSSLNLTRIEHGEIETTWSMLAATFFALATSSNHTILLHIAAGVIVFSSHLSAFLTERCEYLNNNHNNKN